MCFFIERDTLRRCFFDFTLLQLKKRGEENGVSYEKKERAENAVAKFNRQIRRSSFVKTQILPREGGDFSVIMALDDVPNDLWRSSPSLILLCMLSRRYDAP